MNLQPRSGIEALKVYEPGRPLEEVARELGLDPDELIKLASNENALGPSPRAIEAMQQFAGQMHRYPDGGGFYLKQALGAQLDLRPDQLLLGNGSNEIIELLGHVFLEPGVNIVMSECAFVIYKLVASAFGAETIQVPMQGFHHDLDAMRAAITPDTRLVFIANPNNPTGTAVDPAEVMRCIDDAPDHVLVVIDEAYIELMPEDRKPDVLQAVRAGRNVLVMRTFSKAYGLAGLRIGYGMAAPGILQLLEKFRQPFNVNDLAQRAALAALGDTDFVQRTRELVENGLRFWESLCRELGLDYVESVTNFLLIKTGASRETFRALQRHGVIVRPMDGYGLPDHIRVTVGTAAENERSAEALKAVLAHG